MTNYIDVIGLNDAHLRPTQVDSQTLKLYICKKDIYESGR